MFGYVLVRKRSIDGLLESIKEYERFMKKMRIDFETFKAESDELDKLSERNIKGEISWLEYVREFNRITKNTIPEAIKEQKDEEAKQTKGRE